jgi:hypothetical protein
MAIMNFNTMNQTYRQLMGNGLVYRIPPFQRDYSWTSDEWDDLWQDIIAMFELDGEPAHYMGYLVLQSSDNKIFDVIDGQQRLTTLSILILAALKSLKQLSDSGNEADRNNQREQQIRNSFIGYLDPITLVPQSKLVLNRHNDRFYQNHIVPLTRLPQRGLNASEHLLRKAFEWFSDKLGTLPKRNGEDIARFIENLVDKLFFTVITVTDELNAFKVFETLNARGVRLSATDLLKNYLFSVVSNENPHENEIKKLEDDWESIVSLLGSEDFPDFLRVYWNSRYKLVRKSELFKTVRKEIQNKGSVFQLVRNLENSASIYSALKTPTDRLWNDETRARLQQLQMFNVRQPMSLLLAAYEKFTGQDPLTFEKILRAISIISFRYNVICSKQTNEQERVYNDTAAEIMRGNLNNQRDILRNLRSIYINDDEFSTSFYNKELRTTNSRNKKLTRYILFEIEKQVSGNDYDFESDRISIEHVLPENPSEDWPDYQSEAIESLTYYLGNMTLLDADDNRNIGNCAYDKKSVIYASSVYKITQDIAREYTEWNKDKILARQRKLARLALGIWKLEF